MERKSNMENLEIEGLKDFFKGKTILITGHTGFKGSWLTIWLYLLEAKVIGYALDPKTVYDNFVLSRISNKIIDIRADIRDKKKIFEIINLYNPEIIFHLAAQPLVLESYENPYYTIEVNTLGTINILEAFRSNKHSQVLIVITTDKVYKNKEWIWRYRENDELGGHDIYSASKSATEILVEAYNRSFFHATNKKVATVRAGNVIGGGDWSDNRIIPDCIKAIEQNKKILVRNPEAIRPWQFVLEPLFGYLLLTKKIYENNKYIGAWNFGPSFENEINVKSLVEKVIKFYGKGEYLISNNINNNIKESKILTLDNTKAIKELEWQPLYNIDEAVKLTIDWYKNYKDKDIFQLCANQILDFCKKWKLLKQN